MDKKIEILKQILLVSTGEYYEINLTKNIVPGIMYQLVDGKKYSINEKLGLCENAKFTDVISSWANVLPNDEKDGYFKFFDINRLLEEYQKGNKHLSYRYITKTVLSKPMVAQQHIIMYTDDETGEIWAFTYVLDLTEKVREEAYKKRLEENRDELAVRLEKSFEMLDAEREYHNVIYRNYMLAYHLNVKSEKAEVLALSKRAHVYSMPGISVGAVFDYDDHINVFAKRFITKGKTRFCAMLSRRYIDRQMKEKSRFSFRIECVPNISGNVNYEIQVTRVNPDFFDGRVIILSQEIDEIVLAEKERQAELDAERNYLDILTRNFSVVYHVTFKENISTLIKLDTRIEEYAMAKNTLRKSNNYQKRCELYCRKFVIPEQQYSFMQNLNSVNILKELKKTSKFVYRYQTNEGSYFEVQAFPISDNYEKDGVLVAFSNIDDVVTNEQRHQLELERQLEIEINQNEVLNALGNNFYTIALIDLTDKTFEMLNCRDETKHFYINSNSAPEVLGSFCLNFIQADFYEKMRVFFDLKTLNERLEGKNSIEAEYVTTDGNWRRAEFIVKRRSRNGKVSHVMYVTKLISAEKKREERLISMAEAANEANKAKTEFVSKVAHDIRTPMNSLFGFLQIAEANIENAEKVKYSLKKIRVAGEFLKELVNDVLDVSRMENGKLTLNFKEISVKSLFEELPTSMQGADFGKKIEFNFNIHDIFCDKIMGDALRLKQIYTNILSNAVKYTPNGGRVDFEVYEEELPHEDMLRLTVSVSDTGIGMSEEFMKKMFSKFERETDTRLNAVSGYGLGLAIVKQLVDLLGGTIDVKSSIGKGSVFVVKIDVKRAENVENSKKTKKNYSDECKGLRILVAEDNLLSREVMCELLNMNGIICDIAKDGKECIEMFRNSEENQYDAILMDIQMPIMNGIEAAKSIRSIESEYAKAVPIIAMTANALTTDVDQCIAAGMNKHLAKPIDVKKLMHALGKLR